MIQRSITVHKGYDCRVECLHEYKAAGFGGHGIHGDEWVYVVKDMDLRCAMELKVFTSVYPDSVTHEPQQGFATGASNLARPPLTRYL